MRDIFNADRRLAILRFLAEDLDYALNTSVLQDCLAAIGHGVSRDQVEMDVAWLAEMGLVGAETVGDAITVARLAPRGADVAAGRAIVPGVKRPSPRV